LLIFVLLTACTGLNQNSPTQPPCYQKPAAPLSAERPNIVFILTDDQDAASIDYMPETRQLLADQGMQLQNFFVNVPQCCPSRSTILLGKYSHNTGILRNGGDEGGFKTFFRKGLGNATIAVSLQASGYHTGLMGKYLNGYPGAVRKRTYIPPGWDEWVVPVAGTPYSQYQYKLNMNGEIVNFHVEPGDYLTDVLSEQAVDFIRRNALAAQPFFLYLSVYAPHGPATAAPRHAGMFAELSAPRAGSYNEVDVTDKPAYIRNLAALTPPYDAGIDSLYVARLQSLQAVDEMVEQLVTALEEAGELDNTYIIYTSDNGFHLGQHRQEAGKLSPYEEDIHVPMIVRGPDVPAGVTRAEVASNVDLAATFAEMGGLASSDACDGRSLLPIFKDQPLAADEWRQAHLIEYWAGQLGPNSDDAQSSDGTLEPPDPDAKIASEDALPNIPAFKGLRTLDFSYIEYANGEREYYDLQRDPYQLDNLAAMTDPEFLKQLSEWLAHLSTCAGESCRQADQAPAGLNLP
jgi:N-acetylglucosamine-6-sulfatase